MFILLTLFNVLQRFRGYPVVVGLCLPEGTTRSDLKISVRRPDTFWWGNDHIQMVGSFAEVAAAEDINKVYLENRSVKLSGNRSDGAVLII